MLGLSKTATEAEIKSAFRKLAKKYHPDVSKEENAAEKFKEVQEAYAVLSDENKRKNMINMVMPPSPMNVEDSPVLKVLILVV